jgi:(4S)-4-hydroxy-5-phosphonooxypentane-2,3-dione isomerase
MNDGLVILVDFEVAPADMDAFLHHVRENAAASVREEPGCRRFDVLQPEDGGTRIALYEIYDDQAAFEAHLKTVHFAAFDAATRPLVRARSLRRFGLYENAKGTAPPR